MAEMAKQRKAGKLGAAYHEDKRNIKLGDILKERALPPFPAAYDAEAARIGKPFPARMWLNDIYGCCVVAAQANVTRVLEYDGQQIIVDIADGNVKTTYFAESGGSDSGLDMVNSLNYWHKQGWDITQAEAVNLLRLFKWRFPCCKPPKPAPATGEHLTIDAYAQLTTMDEIRAAIYCLGGAQICVSIYQADVDQFEAGQPWRLTGNDGALKGYHCINFPHYLADTSFECWTWADRQPLSADWLAARLQGAFAVVNNKNTKNSPIDVVALEKLLQDIESGSQTV